MTPLRIDTHKHIVPPSYKAWLERRGITAGGKPIPYWSPDDALRFMDANRIGFAVLSLSTPGAYIGDAAETKIKARELNAETAEIVAKHSKRFGFFATLALPDVEAAAAEAVHALDVLKADGIVLLTNTAGVYLGDRSLDPLMQVLNARNAVVFVHPGDLPAPPVPGIEHFVADFLLDSVRAAINIAKSGTLERTPNIRFILSHGGGFLPFAAARVARACTPNGDTKVGLALLRRFYFDTAIASSEFSLPSLFAFADPTHITFGSDRPYADVDRATWFTKELDRYPMDEKLRAAIARDNALALFPRLKSIV